MRLPSPTLCPSGPLPPSLAPQDPRLDPRLSEAAEGTGGDLLPREARVVTYMGKLKVLPQFG